MTRPDIAVMMFDLEPSGVVANGLRIAGAAATAGMQVEVWTVQGGGMQASLPPGVELLSLGPSIGPNYTRQQRKAALRASVPALASAMRERRPRVAFSAGNHFHATALAAAQGASVANLRLIGRVSNALPRFSWQPHRLLQSIRKRIAARTRLMAFDRLVTVSEALRSDLQQKLLIGESKITVIPNGIDLQHVAERAAEPIDEPWFLAGQPPVIVGVGRFVRQKNFEALLRAFADARLRQPMRLILLGDGVERSRLEQLASDLGIADDVKFTGFVANPLPYLARASLFVLPSAWEGMSNALLEAMAIGCPVIATRCAGSVELIGNSKAPEIVPVGDSTALSERMSEMLRCTPPIEHLRERARLFDLERTLSAYVRLFAGEIGD
jgi:glycosyltransferase involved in cell wall biosynthesis